MRDTQNTRVVVIISANAEWDAVRAIFADRDIALDKTPYGECFVAHLDIAPTASDEGLKPLVPSSSERRREPALFVHGGWGKISAAASAQYAIDRWRPKALINLGTCGGFEGEIARGEIVLVEWTAVYDIIEQMLDADDALDYYATEIDLAWLGEEYPQPVRRTLLVSGDRDLLAEEIPRLKAKFGAVAGDWESGAIAWVAARNGVRLLILRGVTDLVGAGGGEAYGNAQLFLDRTREIMGCLVDHLPAWLARAL